MICKLFAVIRCDRKGSHRQRLQDPNHSIRHGLSGLTLDLSQEGQVGLSLGQGNNGMVMLFVDNRIHFPSPRRWRVSTTAGR
jgi:hypothetical protein